MTGAGSGIGRAAAEAFVRRGYATALADVHEEAGRTVEAELRRLRCPDCGARLEAVPWARAGARHTRDLEDTVAWLAQQMAFSPITRLLRIGWRTVGATRLCGIPKLVVAEAQNFPDLARFFVNQVVRRGRWSGAGQLP